MKISNFVGVLFLYVLTTNGADIPASINDLSYYITYKILVNKGDVLGMVNKLCLYISGSNSCCLFFVHLFLMLVCYSLIFN